MKTAPHYITKRLLLLSLFLFVLLLVCVFAGISLGSTGGGFAWVWNSVTGQTAADSMLNTIIWQIRFPRVLMAVLVGATLSLGGLVFQALLRNPLAEPYILGISGGSAIGAIIAILAGLSLFPGVSLLAFSGSIIILVLILAMSSGQSILKKDSLLLSGVIINAFCAAVIMFLISMAHDTKIHNIMFWLMGDLSMIEMRHVGYLALILLPCFAIIFIFSNSMNLMLLGKEMAQSMGVNIKAVTITLLITTSLMVSATVANCGLLGFVGLVMPHLLRLTFGSDHRILVPACILAGGSYMVICDLLARSIPQQGEMPVGVITAMIGAPLFIYLLKRSAR
ncbi:MAG: iron ABC transporter permease [Proteobacteria bacterium]|nr:iron ABC transporter permease [Pseudomonadota bacterium]